jgi:hypothetical protein
MSEKNTSVFGIYSSISAADAAANSLVQGGFMNNDISVLAPDQQTTRELGTEKASKAPEGTAAGAATGGALGGTLGLLAGIGALAIPGLGPFIAAGPIVGALAGLGAGGAVGGFVGALIGLGIPEYEAKRYEGRIKEGGVLLSVHTATSERVTLAKQILERTGAQDISSSGEAGADFPAASARSASRY